jgi:hypothetical protein
MIYLTQTEREDLLKLCNDDKNLFDEAIVICLAHDGRPSSLTYDRLECMINSLKGVK